MSYTLIFFRFLIAAMAILVFGVICSMEQDQRSMQNASLRTDRYETIEKRMIPKTTAFSCEKKTLQQMNANMKSQYHEDEFILEHFNGLCGGTYIEMGALDGVRYSNTHVLNKEFDWKGLLVELNPSSFELLEKNRLNELALVNAGVCKNRTKLHFVKSDNAAVSGIWEFSSRKYRQQWWPTYVDTTKGLPEIECTPLQDILDKHIKQNEQGIHYFDVYSLDVEGAEWHVMQSIDWDRVAFGLLIIEVDTSGLLRELVTSFLDSKGYLFVKEKARNAWFINKDFYEIYQEFAF